MDENHPAPDILARHLRRELPPPEHSAVQRHLAGCTVCQYAAIVLISELRTGHRSEVQRYDKAFERATQQAYERFVQITGAEEAVPLVAKFDEQPTERSGTRAIRLCDLLLKKLREVWPNDPAAAVEIAGLGVSLANRLDIEHYGSSLVEDARVRAWAYLANSYRIASDFRRSEKAFQNCEFHCSGGTADPLTEAEVLSFKASLRTSQGRYDEAVRLLDQTLAICKASEEDHLEGAALIKKGTALGHAGRLDPAIHLIRLGLSRINFNEDPGLVVAGQHNLIGNLSESGRKVEAIESLERARRLHLTCGNQMHLVRLRWLEGRIASDLSHFNEAEAALREAREAFVDRGIGFDAALVSLDLAIVCLRQGRMTDARQLAADMIPIFESRDARQEVLAALVIRQAAAR